MSRRSRASATQASKSDNQIASAVAIQLGARQPMAGSQGHGSVSRALPIWVSTWLHLEGVPPTAIYMRVVAGIWSLFVAAWQCSSGRVSAS